MTSIQERLQIKREPLDKWSTREQLCLASAVVRSGDQNWMSVSRALKPFGDPNRPTDWFHQKNCAAQYGALLENVEIPKRKKRTSGTEIVNGTPAENILLKLKTERLVELKKLIAEERIEYAKLQEDMALLQSGNVTEEQLDQWCKEIDEEEKLKEQEAQSQAKWLKERESRKQELEKVWRPNIKVTLTSVGQKRKASESVDNLMDIEPQEEICVPTTEPGKSALSPLLTSLLKSPSHAQSVVTSSILHSAITSQRPTTTNPTIASLLNSSTNDTVSPGLQQLVTSAIGQDPNNTVEVVEPSTPELPDDAADVLPNLKVEDIESTILASEEPLPEIKNEEVENIISNLIEHADIVTNPEEQLGLVGNVDLMDTLENELQELVKEENAAKDAAVLEDIAQEVQKDKEICDVDPFEFQEDPEIYDQPTVKQNSIKPDVPKEDASDEAETDSVNIETSEETKKDCDDSKREHTGGSVEIVEVVVMEDEEIDKELNKSQIEDIVHSNKVELSTSVIQENCSIIRAEIDTHVDEKYHKDVVACEESNTESSDIEVKSEPEIIKETSISDSDETRANTFTPEFNEEFYEENLRMEVKIDKSGKAKRDYSRTKKKEEKDLDLLFNVENVQLEEEITETFSEKEFQDMEKKIENKLKVKSENERSNSPWTEEEDLAKIQRRYSTPATPTDSVPNSPGSVTAYEDDRDYRNWKKSVMLVYSRLATHKYASLFLKPITNEQAPGYHSVVHRPMDLHAIRKNIENGGIRTTDEFQRDVLLMFNNAIMYNKTNEHVFNMALEMQRECIPQVQILLLAQEDVPARRETRTSEPGSKRKRPPEDNARNKKRKDD